MDDRLAFGEGELGALGGIRLLPSVRVDDGSGGSLEALADSTDAFDEVDVDDLRRRAVDVRSANRAQTSKSMHSLVDLGLRLLLHVLRRLYPILERLGPD